MDRPASASGPSAARSGRQPSGELGACCYCFVGMVFAMTMILALVALPLRATVTDASLARLDLVVVTSNGTGNGTGIAASSSVSVAYNLSLTVRLRNPNWAMRVEVAAPLGAELRFAGRRLDGARLADPDPGTSIKLWGAEEFRVLAASSPAGATLGRAGAGGAAAELARERAEGVFQVELRIAGRVKYRQGHAGRSSRLEATCPLKLLLPNAPPRTRMVVLQKGVVSCY